MITKGNEEWFATEDGLTGLWFISGTSQVRRRERGRIRDKVTEDLYLVYFEADKFSKLVKVETMADKGWTFFTDPDRWRRVVEAYDENWAEEFKEELERTMAALPRSASNKVAIRRPSRRDHAERKAKEPKRVAMVKDEGLWAEIQPMLERGRSEREIAEALTAQGRKISQPTVHKIIAARRLGLVVLDGGQAG